MRVLTDCCLHDGEVMCVSVCGGWRSDPRDTNGISRQGPDWLLAAWRRGDVLMCGGWRYYPPSSLIPCQLCIVLWIFTTLLVLCEVWGRHGYSLKNSSSCHAFTCLLHLLFPKIMVASRSTAHTWPETLPMQKKISNQFFCISYIRDTPWCQPVKTEPQTLGERALLSFLLVFWAWLPA